MASFSRSAINAFGAGYNSASPNTDKSGKTAYQRYIEKFYGPDVQSHNDPIALARAATGAVEQGLKSGAGFLAHAAAGLLGMPRGDSSAGAAAVNAPQLGMGGIGSDRGAVSGITPTNRLYGGNPGTGAGVSAYDPGSTRQGMDGVLDAISRAEGTVKNGYNEILGSGAYGRPSKPITDMTLQEVHDFGRNTLFAGQRAQGKKEKDLSSATGRYQITGTNIKEYATKWGLDMKTTKWTPQLQDRIAVDMAKNTPKGLANWEGFKSNPKLKQQAIAALNGQPVSALAYASTDPNLTPAQQAAAAQASGTGRLTYDSKVADMQRDLNSRGAKLEVDGLRGPLTRQAEQQYYGSPTSVRTPSITNRPTYTSGQQDQGSVPTAGSTRTAYVPGQSSYTSGRGDEGTVPKAGVPTYTSRANTTIPYSGRQDQGTIPRAGVSTPQTPYYNNPYTNSTGGANALTPRSVQTVAIQSDVAHKSPLPSYYQSDPDSGFAPLHGFNKPPVHWGNVYGDDHLVPTVSVPYNSTMPAPLVGGFVRPNVPQTPAFMNPYTSSTGGANAIAARVPQARPPQPGDTPTPYLNQPYTMPSWGAPTTVVPVARIPQARPNYQAPVQEAVPTLIDRLGNLVERAERALGGSKGSDSRGSNSRSGGGGNYSGGTYGGGGGSRISEGVGGAFKNR